MNKIEICKKIELTTQKILLFSDDKLISTGTGVVVRSDGVILTANHVINGFANLSNPKIIVIGRDENGVVLHREYAPVLYNVSFDVNETGFITPFVIDLAILKPKEKISVGDNIIPLCDDIVQVGTDVFMAGFPDEIKLPFDFDSKLRMLEKEGKVVQTLDSFMALMMIKSGMVGAAHKINMKGVFNSKEIQFVGASYWVDNASTYGASGGALVNSSGELIGILCEKAETKFIPGLSIPSGSTMALSHKLITWGMYLCD